MTWLADADVDAANGLARSVAPAPTPDELRRLALQALDAVVPADAQSWDRIELSTGTVSHEAAPAGAEHPGAFEAVVARAADHPLLAAHAAGRRPALRLSELVEPVAHAHSLLYNDLLHDSGVEYEIAIAVRSGRGDAVVIGLGRTEREFSQRDRDVLDIARPALEDAVRSTQARVRLRRARDAGPPPGTAVVLLDGDGEIEHAGTDARRWLAEHFGPAEHPGWLPAAVAEWLALPPRPPLISRRDGRRLTVWLLPGDPHALLLEEQVTTLRPDALDRLGLTARESEVLCAATVISQEAEIAWELFLSLHAVRQRLAGVEAKLGVRTAAEAVARARAEST